VTTVHVLPFASGKGKPFGALAMRNAIIRGASKARISFSMVPSSPSTPCGS